MAIEKIRNFIQNASMEELTKKLESYGIEFTERPEYYFYFCNECEYLNPTEQEQTKKKEHHICQKYNVRVYHREFHPNIVKCSACTNENICGKEIR